MQVLNEPVTVERGKEGVISLQLTVPFGCYFYYDGDEKKRLPCFLNVELRNRQHIECEGIKTQSLCGTKFQNEHWDAVNRVFVQHTNDLKYLVSMYVVKLFTLQMESHPIWSNVEISEVKVNLNLLIKYRLKNRQTDMIGRTCIQYICFETCRSRLKRNNQNGKGRHVTLAAILI